jgi:hypothetical protein
MVTHLIERRYVTRERYAMCGVFFGRLVKERVSYG